MKAKKRDIWIDRIKVGKSRLQRAMYNELPCGGEKKKNIKQMQTFQSKETRKWD